MLRLSSDIFPGLHLHTSRDGSWKKSRARLSFHPDYARASAGEWPEKDSIFNAFREEINLINQMTTNIWGSIVVS